MQLGRKSQSGLRAFLRSDAIVIADKKGKPKVVIGALNEVDNGLRSGKPSSFNKLGRAEKENKMPEPKSISHVTTKPKPFGVNVEWKWPDLSFWGSRLELQYLLADGRLLKEVINWPVTEFMISGLKAGERLQVRLRPVAADGSVRDWRASDWIEGVTSVDAAEMVQALQDGILSNPMFDALSCDGGISPEEMRDAVEHIKRTRLTKALGKSLAELSPFTMKNGQVFINDAFIGNGITSDSGRIYASGMGVSVDNGKEQVEFEAEKFEIAASSKDPLDSALQEAIKKIVNEALQKATQPGGLLHSRK